MMCLLLILAVVCINLCICIDLTTVASNDTASAALLNYNIIIDAGSTGTRIYIYSYIKNDSSSLKEIAHKRLTPALSTLHQNTALLQEQLGILVDFATLLVPEDQWIHTNISLKATAGLRQLPDHEQNWLVDEIRNVLNSSNFLFHPYDTKIIDGDEEALYDFMAFKAAIYANLIPHVYDGNNSGSSSSFKSLALFGVADLGGSSQQISFILPEDVSLIKATNAETDINPTAAIASSGNYCRAKWVMTEDATQESMKLFGTSFNKMGLIAAMDKMVHTFYANYTSVSNSTSVLLQVDGATTITTTTSPTQPIRLNPCLPPGKFPPYEGIDTYDSYMYGSGNFDDCVELIRATVIPNTKLTINDTSCISDLTTSLTIVGMDNFPKVLELLKLSDSKVISPSMISNAAVHLCRRSWDDIMNEFNNFMPYRAQRACFATSYIYALLVDVFGMPPMHPGFLPMDSLPNGMELAWPLGAAFLATSSFSIEKQ